MTASQRDCASPGPELAPDVLRAGAAGLHTADSVLHAAEAAGVGRCALEVLGLAVSLRCMPPTMTDRMLANVRAGHNVWRDPQLRDLPFVDRTVRLGLRRRIQLRNAMFGNTYGARGVAWQEPGRDLELAAYAGQLACAIVDEPAWRSQEIAAHRGRLHPLAEALLITLDAVPISTLRRELGPRPEVAAAARSAWDAGSERLDRLLVPLANRVVRLAQYLDRLQEVGRQQTALTAIEATKGIEGRLTGLEAAAPGIDAGCHTRELCTELDAVTTQIADIAELLTGGGGFTPLADSVDLPRPGLQHGGVPGHLPGPRAPS